MNKWILALTFVLGCSISFSVSFSMAFATDGSTVELKPNDVITFVSPKDNVLNYGLFQKMDLAGNVRFLVREFVSDGFSSHIEFRDYLAHKSHLGLPVNEMAGFKAGDEVCFNGQSGDLDKVFSNGTGLFVVGDFFGARFLMFEKWQVIELSKLNRCD